MFECTKVPATAHGNILRDRNLKLLPAAKRPEEYKWLLSTEAGKEKFLQLNLLRCRTGIFVLWVKAYYATA